MQWGTEVARDLYTHENMLMFWSHRTGLAPWQTQAWTDEMARTLRPAQYQRLIENRWTASASTFVELSEWDACCDPDLLPIGVDKSMRVWAGLDLGLRHDATALVVVAADGDKLVLVDHHTFTPEKARRSTLRLRQSRCCATSPGALTSVESPSIRGKRLTSDSA